MPLSTNDDDKNTANNNGISPVPGDPQGLVCKPSDGRRRISFATADEYSLEMPRHGIKGNLDKLKLTEVAEDVSMPPKRKKKSSKGKDRRESDDDILTEYMLAESGIDQVWGDIYTSAERKKFMIEVSLAPLRSGISSQIGELPAGRKMHPFWEMCRSVLFVISMIVLLGSFVYGCIGVNQNQVFTEIDTSIKPGELVGPTYSLETGVPRETNHFPKVEISSSTMVPTTTRAPNPSVPGDDIAEFRLGNVQQPIEAEDVQELLDHDMLKGVRVVCEHCALDLQAERTVTVGTVEIKCGIVIDNISLVFICEDDKCDAYFVGAHYCDAYANNSNEG